MNNNLTYNLSDIEAVIHCNNLAELNVNCQEKTKDGNIITKNIIDEFENTFLYQPVKGEQIFSTYVKKLYYIIYGKMPTYFGCIKRCNNSNSFLHFLRDDTTQYKEYIKTFSSANINYLEDKDDLCEYDKYDILKLTALLKKYGAYLYNINLYGQHIIALFENCILSYEVGDIITVKNYLVSSAFMTILSPGFKWPSKLQKILDECKYKDNNEKSKFGMLLYTGSKWEVRYNTLIADKPDIDFNLNYNKDLPLKNIQEFINNDNGNNQLIALHGTPGTGKTTFIRWLSAVNPDINFYILQGAELNNISHSSFIDCLISIKGSIIIIEDCEALLDKRTNGNSYISTLLNLTDGILGAALKLKFLCTFNTNKNNIDTALLRKGRLYLEYAFEKLSEERAKKLLEKIGKSEYINSVNAPIALCDLYNIDKDNNGNVNRKIATMGFCSKKS